MTKHEKRNHVPRHVSEVVRIRNLEVGFQKTVTIHRESDCKFRRGTGNYRTVRNRKDLSY